MRLLLDTHVLLWALAGDRRLGTRAKAAIRDPANDVFVSVASLWEIVIKVAAGRLELNGPADQVLLDAMSEGDLEPLDIRSAHVFGVGTLPPHHGDPFDRLLVAQARVEDMTLVTADAMMARYDVPRLPATR